MFVINQSMKFISFYDLVNTSDRTICLSVLLLNQRMQNGTTQSDTEKMNWKRLCYWMHDNEIERMCWLDLTSVLSHPIISPYETCWHTQYVGSFGSTGISSTSLGWGVVCPVVSVFVSSISATFYNFEIISKFNNLILTICNNVNTWNVLICEMLKQN